jgi:transglutaminase-like putative cysteine protease
MILKVVHTTLFEYEDPIYETATEVRLHPVTGSRAMQQCVNFSLHVSPSATIFDYSDFYGNLVHHFNILQSHKQVQITATSAVETGTGIADRAEDNEIYLMDFCGESRYVHFDPAVCSFSDPFRNIADTYRQAIEICGHINDAFQYEPGVTDVHSTSAVVMALGRGVCQDFAHIMIAVCRNLGIPARYVSGYLYGGGSTPEGRDEASHAWCEIYCGPEKGWIGFDPTHSTLLVDDRYIKIGCGRDYADVPPVRGTYKGTSSEKLSVSVRVSSFESALC